MNRINGAERRRIVRRRFVAANGYSLVEILVVVSILAILGAISIPYAISHTKLYKTEDQALKVMDLMREASQLALNRRRTVRFEINLNDNTAKITDENGAAPDILVKSIPLEPVNEVRMDAPPLGVSPPNPPNYALVSFGSPRVWTVRFRSDGSAVNAGNTPVSATLYFWPPKKVPYDAADLEPRQRTEVRAVTIFGGSGAVRYWKHDGTTFVPYQ